MSKKDGGDRSALDELLGDTYIAAIRKGNFPESCTDVLIAYCRRHSDFGRYVFEAAKQGNMDIAKTLYDAGMVYWTRMDDDNSRVNLTQRYIDGAMEYMKSRTK